MKAIVYVTKIPETYEKKNMHHMIGEELLAYGLRIEYGKELKFEPRAKGEHEKPFFTLLPEIHYNISHSGKYVFCVFAEQEVGIDVQEHRKASYEKVLTRMVTEEERERILRSEDVVKEFYEQWVLREAYIKWTGEGLARDLRTISLNEGWHAFLPVEEGYTAAIYLAEEHELEIKEVEIPLP